MDSSSKLQFNRTLETGSYSLFSRHQNKSLAQKHLRATELQRKEALLAPR